MRVGIFCECSGKGREAFRALGHDAWSIDLKPSEDNSPFHIQGDALDHIGEPWDLILAHPVCKYLANSGAKHLYKYGIKECGEEPERWENMHAAVDFFRVFQNATHIPKRCIENPIIHGPAKEFLGKQTQVIQPWMFGHLEQKATCLWLYGLEPLIPTDNVYDEMMLLPYKERAKVHYASPGPDRETNAPDPLTASSKQWRNNGAKWKIIVDT